MKKLIALILLGTVISANAASTTLTVAASGMSNILSSFQGNATITQVILTAPANNTASVIFVDSRTNQLSYTNAAYIGVASYVTNAITCWTNFFGSTNCITNVALVDITNTVAAATVTYPFRITATAPTNGSYTVGGVNYYFNNGIWVTNTGSGAATLTVTYVQ